MNRRLTGKRLLAAIGTVATMVVLAAALLPFGSALAASATRTWVSGVGDDANPCSRTAPCKTFAGAISKTATSGEISVLDPGGFGAITITKNISIVADGSEGGILAAATTGVIVNAPGIVVNLRGLTIEGAGTGFHGVRFLQGSSLTITDSVIRGFRASGVGNGNGIVFAPNTTAELHVSNTVIESNGSATSGAGILVKPPLNGGARVSLNGVQVLNNRQGIVVDGTTSTNPLNLTMVDTTASGNTNEGILAVTNAVSTQIMMDSSASVNNGTAGVSASGAGAVIRIARSSISGNVSGIRQLNSSNINSYGTNQIRGNTANIEAGSVLSPLAEQ